MNAAICPEMTPLLNQLYALAAVVDQRSRCVPDVPEPLTVRHVDGALVVHGDVDMATSPDLAVALAPWLLPGAEVRLHLGAVSFLGSSGARVLEQAATALGPSGRLVVLDPSRAAQRALDVFGGPFAVAHRGGDGSGTPSASATPPAA